MGEALHPRRVEILRYLARRAGSDGPPPSVREIGAAVGLRSSQTVHHHLGRLEEEGYGPILREAGLDVNVPDHALLVPKGPELDLEGDPEREPVEAAR